LLSQTLSTPYAILRSGPDSHRNLQNASTNGVRPHLLNKAARF
jgi:hypothetical protein